MILSIHFPLTREDMNLVRNHVIYHLSIHFPLTREDNGNSRIAQIPIPFNPLPSHEGRHKAVSAKDVCESFQSTSLSRGKTDYLVRVWRMQELSIHFPLTREDTIGMFF